MDPLQTSIMTAFGFDKLPAEQQAELFARVGAVLFQGILIRAIEGMSDAEQDALDAFLTAHPDDAEALMGYLREHVDGFDALAADEAARFRASATELLEKPVA